MSSHLLIGKCAAGVPPHRQVSAAAAAKCADMPLYPHPRARRTATIAIDAVALLLVAAFLLLGIVVRDTVLQLDALGRGVERAGQGVQDGFDGAGERVRDLPVVGDDLDEAFRGAGRASGGEVAASGRRGRDAVRDTANLLAFVTGALPALVVLSGWLPFRVRGVRSRRAAALALAAAPLDEQRARLIASRAFHALSFRHLRRYTDDPVGCMLRGDHGPLVRAAFEHEGLRRPAVPAASPDGRPSGRAQGKR